VNDTGVIDNFLQVFTTYIDSGFGLLGDEIAFLSTTLIAIDLTIAGLFWAWGADEDVLQRLIKKTLYFHHRQFLDAGDDRVPVLRRARFEGNGRFHEHRRLHAPRFHRRDRLGRG
jgi:hypothetical protein